MEYCNWYDMVSVSLETRLLLNYFQNQHRGYTVDLIVKDEDGYLHFGGKKEGDTFLEGIENWQEPGENIEIHHGNILMPYPERMSSRIRY